jgi:hypothetical protein
MKQFPRWMVLLLLAIFTITDGLYADRLGQGKNPDPIIVEGSTPGDEEIKLLLDIPAARNIDFIRWHLVMRPGNASNTGTGNRDYGTFTLRVDFGISKPNTLGFTGDRGQKTVEGTVRQQPGKEPGATSLYTLNAKELPEGIQLYAINANLFHILSRKKELLTGNGGWSFTLNRSTPGAVSESLPNTLRSDLVMHDTARTITYHGRTPCVEIARDKHLTVPGDCFKLKWKLVLHKNEAGLPSTYSLYRTGRRQEVVTGKWSFIPGHATNPGSILLRLDGDDKEQPTSLLLLDPQVAIFLDNKDSPYTGNKDFSYTLDRRR